MGHTPQGDIVNVDCDDERVVPLLKVRRAEP